MIAEKVRILDDLDESIKNTILEHTDKDITAEDINEYYGYGIGCKTGCQIAEFFKEQKDLYGENSD